MNIKEAVRVLADEAQRQNANASDTNGIVRALVVANGFGFGLPKASLAVAKNQLLFAASLADWNLSREAIKNSWEHCRAGNLIQAEYLKGYDAERAAERAEDREAWEASRARANAAQPIAAQPIAA